MTNIRFHFIIDAPKYRTYKKKAPKLLAINHFEFDRDFMSHDYDQAACYAKNYIDSLRKSADSDINFSYDAEYLETIFS